ncbi:MAG: M24 family metallopeptidase [Planctomycetes bacterium]|nr:M24 family metallopeptidase [Planctomycetota bacterium]
MNAILERLSGLRGAMRTHGISHYLVPSADEHINEYLPRWNARREWLSGFSGSAGDLLVGIDPHETVLFTDGRYHLQAERQLAGTSIALERVGTKDAKTLGQKISEFAKAHGAKFVLGFDPAVLAIGTVEALEKLVQPHGARLAPIPGHLVDALWHDRERPPTSPLIACPSEWSGASVAQKLDALRRQCAKHDATALTVVKLDQIAWLLNLRSLDDVPYNPVFEAFLYVDATSVHVFVHGPDQRLSREARASIPGLVTHEYAEFVPFLERVANARVLLDPDATTQSVLNALTRSSSNTIVRSQIPIELAKAVKNEHELRCMERANLLASFAKARALRWLDERVAAGDHVTEASFRDRIEAYYADLPGYRGLSFNTISATGKNGAIIHYGEAGEHPLRDGELFLIDSGIQCDGGTTDATRTVAVGTPTAEQRRLFTRVLQAHIGGAKAVFPEGTSGAAIDALVRAPMWSDGLNYDHGTGHGVGAFLCVHEGPFAIAEPKRRANAVIALAPGMITSIEPGYYRADFGGIRIENLYVVKDLNKVVDGKRYFGLESLTWVPFDERLIDRAELTRAELAWLDHYQAESARRLATVG